MNHCKKYTVLLLVVLLVLMIQACDTINKDVAPLIAEEPEIPVFDAKTFYAASNESIVIDLLSQANVKSASSFRIEKQPAFGTALFLQKSLVIYTPEPTATNVEDWFLFSLSGNTTSGSTSTQIRSDTIRIKVFNDPRRFPCNAGAMHDEASVLQNSSVVIPVLANDLFCKSVIDSSSLKIEVAPIAGKAEVEKNRITYTPRVGYKGSDFLVYKVCTVGDKPVCRLAAVRINVVADPKECKAVLMGEGIVWTRTGFLRDTSLVIDVLRNDVLCETHNTSALKISKFPQNGKVIVNQNNTLTYTPKPTFQGIDTFEYTKCDKDGKSCLSAVVKIQVIPPDPNCKPSASNETILISANVALPTVATVPQGSIEIPILANDRLCTDVKEIKITSPPKYGEVRLDKLRVFYFPKAGYVGDDKFQYELTNIKDQKASANVTIKIVK